MMVSSLPHLPLPRRIVTLALLLGLAACAARVPPPPPDRSAQCLAQLDQRGVQYQLAAVPASRGGCTIDNPVSVTGASIAWNQPGVVSCGFAVELERFEREAIQPAALAHFHRRIVRIRHFGTYACRTTHGGRPSEHAQGKAIDIAGFELEDGTVVTVEHDWRRQGAQRAFLRDIAHRACRYFSVVLTPDSDRDHYNHIHLDIGPYPLCG